MKKLDSPFKVSEYEYEKAAEILSDVHHLRSEHTVELLQFYKMNDDELRWVVVREQSRQIARQLEELFAQDERFVSSKEGYGKSSVVFTADIAVLTIDELRVLSRTLRGLLQERSA